ncbi:MAG: hypothetical protein Q4D38_14765 [Planctomycetia bacterium]|nr:hypothetical protein [Planctomycetia bacterium]
MKTCVQGRKVVSASLSQVTYAKAMELCLKESVRRGKPILLSKFVRELIEKAIEAENHKK